MLGEPREVIVDFVHTFLSFEEGPPHLIPRIQLGQHWCRMFHAIGRVEIGYSIHSQLGVRSRDSSNRATEPRFIDPTSRKRINSPFDRVVPFRGVLETFLSYLVSDRGLLLNILDPLHQISPSGPDMKYLQSLLFLSFQGTPNRQTWGSSSESCWLFPESLLRLEDWVVRARDGVNR